MKFVGKFFLTALFLIFAWNAYLVFDLYSCQWSQSDSKIRMLLIGDPQIEGNVEGFAPYNLTRIVLTLNDYYMKFLMETMVNQLNPTHVVVMGDLFSFQDTTDTEFASRAERYRWIFDAAISRGIITNITGNHDLGYAHELTPSRLERFEKEFGLSNFDYRIPLDEDLDSDGVSDSAFVTVINNLVMDPTKELQLKEKVWTYVRTLRDVRMKNLYEPMIMIAHVPLYKQSGCVDKPHTELDSFGFVSRQNHLSFASSQYIIETISPDIVLTGHDHHGCNYKHQNTANRVVQEYTVRSIMGDFSGTGALLEVYKEGRYWLHKYKYCHFVPLRYLTTTAVFTFVLIVLSMGYFIGTCIAQCCHRTRPSAPKAS